MRSSIFTRMMLLIPLATILGGCATAGIAPASSGWRAVTSLSASELQTIRRERGPIVLVDRNPRDVQAKHVTRDMTGLGPDGKIHHYLLDLCTGELLENGSTVLQYPGEWGGADVCDD